MSPEKLTARMEWCTDVQKLWALLQGYQLRNPHSPSHSQTYASWFAVSPLRPLYLLCLSPACGLVQLLFLMVTLLFLFFLLTTSTVMGSLAERNTLTASSCLQFETSTPFTWGQSKIRRSVLGRTKKETESDERRHERGKMQSNCRHFSWILRF